MGTGPRRVRPRPPSQPSSQPAPGTSRITVAVIRAERADLLQFHSPPDIVVRVTGQLTVNFLLADVRSQLADRRRQFPTAEIGAVMIYDDVSLAAFLGDIVRFFREICPLLAAPRSFIQFNVENPNNPRGSGPASNQVVASRANVGTGGLNAGHLRQLGRICPKAVVQG
jgi:hypothetical protein